MKKGLMLAGLVTAAAVSLLSLSAWASRGSENVSDAARILSHLSENANDNEYDAALILQYTVGLIDRLPVVEPTVTPSLASTPEPTDIPQPTIAPEPAPEPTPTPTPKPDPTLTPTPTLEPTPRPSSTPEPTTAPHIHEWTMHEATGHFETQKIGEEEAAVGTYWEEIGGWDEDRAAYYQCNDCGAAFSSNLEASEHITSAYHSSYSYYPAETVHHDGEWVKQIRYETQDVYEDVWVIDRETYWTCSCGETRNTQP